MKKLLLIGDTHPEMIAIAEELAERKIGFRLILPTYFTEGEARLLANFGIRFTRFNPWLKKRTLSSSIRREHLMRRFATLELLAWLTKRQGLDQISWRFGQLYRFLVKKEIGAVLKTTMPSLVVSYDTISIPQSLSFKHIVICPMTHPASVSESLAHSKGIFPNWPVMSDEMPMGNTKSAKAADNIVVLSHFAKSSYVNAGFAEKNIDVIHIGPINGSDYLQTRMNIREDRKISILYLGRMTRIKGVEALMQVSHLLDPNDFSIQLVGQSSPKVAEYIINNSNKKVLALHINPTPSEVSSFYRKCQVFVLPSFNEGFSIASLEAMSHGLIPILSTNTGVSEILLGTPLADFIIDPGNVSQLHVNLLSLLELKESEFNALQDSAINISKSYTFDNFATKFVNRYLEVDTY
jgi:glycosyltransferase involved in cell wall biosynthesis